VATGAREGDGVLFAACEGFALAGAAVLTGEATALGFGSATELGSAPRLGRATGFGSVAGLGSTAGLDDDAGLGSAPGLGDVTGFGSALGEGSWDAATYHGAEGATGAEDGAEVLPLGAYPALAAKAVDSIKLAPANRMRKTARPLKRRCGTRMEDMATSGGRLGFEFIFRLPHST